MSSGNGKHSDVTQLLEIAHDALKMEGGQSQSESTIRWQKINTAILTVFLTPYFTVLPMAFVLFPIVRRLTRE